MPGGRDRRDQKSRSLTGTLFSTAAQAAIAIMAAGTTQVALAQTASDQVGGDGEIVVTAQRREQSIQDVGIAITAFSGEQLREMGASSSIDIARLTPGLSISSTSGGQNSQFSIRGVVQNDFGDFIEGPVAAYVDDTYIPNLNGQLFGTFDVQRVEVLKGPQGTLFGRNATGGLIHFIPNRPSDTANGFLDLSYGRFNHVRAEGAIGLPLSEKVQIRLSGLFNRFDPILKNIYPYGVSSLVAGTTPPGPKCCEDLWNDNTVALRGQIQFEPTERLTIRATGSYARTRFGENPYNATATIGVFDAEGRLVNVQFAGPNETRMNIGPNGENVGTNGLPTAQMRPTPGGDFFGYRAPSAKSLTISKDWALDDLNRLKSYDGALHLNYEFDGAELVSISNYRRFFSVHGTDVDAGPENLINFLGDSRQRSFSQEVRLAGTGKGAFRWVTGFYYLYVKTNAYSGFVAPSNSIFAASFGPPFATDGIDLINEIHLETRSVSGFGQIEYDFAPKLSFILGGRLIREHQEYSFDSFAHANVDDYDFDHGPALFPLQDSFADKRSKTLWAGKAQVEYRPDSDTLLYLGVSRGVKGGAYNAALPDGSPSLSPDRIPYRPETLTAYELGLKATFLDGKATFDAATYYYDYKDYQAFTFANVSGIVSNNDARVYGFEASLNLRPVRGLHIGLGVSLLDAKVYDLELAPGLITDVKPSFTPGKTFSGQIAYTVPQKVLGGNVSFNLDGSWRSKVYGNIRNFDADVIDAYFLANGHVFFTTGDERYKIGFGVENILDKRYRNVTFNLATLCGCNEESYGTPRWWNVSMRTSF
ncbi:TonB-dependent receptor plug domain-containing protein [Sphingobium sp. AS12]|uniref:TonB-dependent receptor n=1 Tax=Sphingobium sp. AS12 TaxID=2849495 RepID=UPI001C3148B9|nr:TonB-dependent receptor plug domain-containing protein [Sphingobium sp. AS12]MBV2149828.1 TonB-dependent receptor plug domain-containing protein [Sphingobium sp. AS12]